ncbi:hypothetical protein ABT095_20930 [Kitasatospora sp. NPDC002227]|uniref:hypothetical protein n=1 Tax=Kitasatospora sp. NPDC002227 TaxID=3154773 RepID=UPI00332E99AE
MSNWSPGIFVLAGAGVGAATSIGTTWLARVHERRQSIANEEREAVRQLLSIWWDVEVHARLIPDTMAQVLNWWGDGDSDDWNTRLQDILGPAAAPVEALRDSSRREAIREQIDVVADWPTPLHYHRTNPYGLIIRVADHARASLGAYLRQEPAPPAPRVVQDAREARGLRREEHKMQVKEDEKQQRESAAERQRKRDANGI